LFFTSNALAFSFDSHADSSSSFLTAGPTDFAGEAGLLEAAPQDAVPKSESDFEEDAPVEAFGEAPSGLVKDATVGAEAKWVLVTCEEEDAAPAGHKLLSLITVEDVRVAPADSMGEIEGRVRARALGTLCILTEC
jgi:hypothetical protein